MENKNLNFKKVLIIIFSCIFILAVVSLICIFIKNHIGETKSGLIDIYNEDKTVKNVEKSDEKSPRILKLEELQKENKEIVAYIDIEGTNISYPVLQTIDNDYYLFKNYKKQYSQDGSIFLDKDVSLSMPSSNFLMYGHNNQNGKMFSDLLKFRDESYYNQHKKIRFITNNEDAEYEIMSVFFSRVYFKSEKNVFRYYYFVNAKNKQEFYEYVKQCKEASIYDTGVTAEYKDQLITLSTCSYHTEEGRFVVVARKIK